MPEVPTGGRSAEQGLAEGRQMGGHARRGGESLLYAGEIRELKELLRLGFEDIDAFKYIVRDPAVGRGF